MNELPAGWTTVAIGDICSQAEQRVPETHETFAYIDIASVDRVRKAVLEPQILLGSHAPSRARKVVASGDIIVSMTRPNLNAVAMIDDHFDTAIASTGFDVLRPEGADPRWIFAAVRSAGFVDAMTAKVQGALYPAIKSGDIRNYEIPLPPSEEQKRIAQKLDALLAQVDTLKARINAVPALLKRFRQAVLVEAMSEGCFESTDAWVPRTIGEVGEVITGSTPSTKTKDNYGGNVCFFKPSDLNLGYRTTDSSDKLSQEGSALARVIPEMTVMVTCIGATIGKAGLSRTPGATNQQINSVICNKELVYPEWLYFWVISPFGQAAIIENSSATTLPILNKSKFSALSLNVPPLYRQAEIVRRVELLFAFAEQLEVKVSAAQKRIDSLTQSLLAKAFRGELVPQDPNDEPATVLLERIRARRAAAPKPNRGRKAAAR